MGPVAGGTKVVISGTGLTGATAVTFGATPATSFTVNSDTQITALAHAGAAGTAQVTVTTAGGTSNVSGRCLMSSAPSWSLFAWIMGRCTRMGRCPARERV
ncbi:IPT/TIG domain-containing protein [Nocardia sp. NPDC049220]|uniref:IPT/TIG domain-containing protein n=1 Tax=Nocardia sp. NPDC049220 TaxID=3155273 RepID=UPI0033E7EC58